MFTLILKNNLKTKAVVCDSISFFMTIGFLINNEVNHVLLTSIFVLIGSLIATYCLVSLIYALFDYISSRSNNYHPKCVIKNCFLVSLILLIISYSFQFLIFYPGMFNYDAPAQLKTYLSNCISEWHPVLHTVIIGKIIEYTYALGFDIEHGIAVYTVLQYVVCALCFSYMLSFVYKKTGKISFWLLSFLFLAFFPTIVLQVMSSTKDTFFMAFYALTMTLTIGMLSDESDFFKSIFGNSIWVISVLLMIIFRNNCIFAIPVFLICLLIFLKNKKKIMFLESCVLLLYVLYKALFVPAFVGEIVDGREMLSVPAQQLAGIYIDDGSKISDEDKDIIENLFDSNLFTADELLGFIPSSADNVKEALDMNYYHEHRAEVNRTWFRIICNNPKAALKIFLDLNCGFWYPIYDLTLFRYGVKGYWLVGSLAPYSVNSRIPSLYEAYQFFSVTDFSDIGKVPVFLIFAPATFFYIFIIMFGYSCIKKKREFMPMFFFTLTLWLTYLLGPMALVRYTTYLYAMIPLYFIIITKHNNGNKLKEVVEE